LQQLKKKYSCEKKQNVLRKDERNQREKLRMRNISLDINEVRAAKTSTGSILLS
jgi:hypothetical protein